MALEWIGLNQTVGCRQLQFPNALLVVPVETEVGFFREENRPEIAAELSRLPELLPEDELRDP